MLYKRKLDNSERHGVCVQGRRIIPKEVQPSVLDYGYSNWVIEICQNLQTHTHQSEDHSTGQCLVTDIVRGVVSEPESHTNLPPLLVFLEADGGSLAERESGVGEREREWSGREGGRGGGEEWERWRGRRVGEVNVVTIIWALK